MYSRCYIADFPSTADRKMCNGTEKLLQTFPHCRSSPIPFLLLYVLTLYIFIIIVVILWKIPVIYITEYNSFIIKRLFEQTIFTLYNTQNVFKISYLYFFYYHFLTSLSQERLSDQA